MTIEEALYTARQYVNCNRATDKKCLEIDCRDCEHDFHFDALTDSIEMMCERLTPKKPNEEGRTKLIITCPTCGKFLHIKDRMKHCWECGQALDWSDTE